MNHLKKAVVVRAVLVLAILIAIGWGIGPTVTARWGVASTDTAMETPVLIARRYIPAFSVLQAADFGVRAFPKALVPPGALGRPEDLQTPEGRPLFSSAVAIPEGHLLTRALAVDASRPESLTALLRPGKVAVSFETDRAHGVGGWIKPGDNVTLFKTLLPDQGSRRREGATRLLFSSVLVLAVDQSRLGEKPNPNSAPEDPLSVMSREAAETRVVTVLVTPMEASLLIEAREQGPINLVLRSLDDALPWPVVPGGQP